MFDHLIEDFVPQGHLGLPDHSEWEVCEGRWLGQLQEVAYDAPLHQQVRFQTRALPLSSFYGFTLTPLITCVNCSSGTKFTVNGLKPFTVYAFQIQVQQQWSPLSCSPSSKRQMLDFCPNVNPTQAVNEVGNSRTSRQSYPAITLMESKSTIR